ncbi:protein-cysteine N-palmitoyltransferase HHAT [Dermacentor silvarum]|uniref:protein-cysteine N-palmitoyltransferase HHAT n=1 Tax=Dermacentor silvarum TaxID=543639 RepID=UPI0021013505|nr:protein-cysteine N-palmitoyltransferase HHAT [Dermacentor silvarum]
MTCNSFARMARAVVDTIARYGYLRVAHWTAWPLLLFYAAYSVVQKRAEIVSALHREVRGFCNRYECKQRDYGDFEWDAIITLLWSMKFWILTHLVVGQLLAAFASRFLQHFYVAYSLLFMILCFPTDLWIRTAIMATASCVSVWLRRRSVVYVVGALVVATTTLSFMPRYEFSPCVIGGERSIEASVFFTGWNVLRCVSVAADLIDRTSSAPSDARKHVLHALAYLLYFPALIVGPVTNYDDFMKEPYRPPAWNRKRLLHFLLWCVRLVLGYCVMEGFLRVAYVPSAAMVPRWFHAQSGWTLAGLVYLSALQFYLKYNFAYGVPTMFFWLDGVCEGLNLRPRCTARIHTAANMWRYFDIALYRWIVKYLYKAVIANRWTVWWRFLGTSASFAFVLLWHTVQPHMLLWTTTNYLLVMAEMICVGIAAAAPVRSWLTTRCGPVRESILKGMLCAVNLVGSYGSCFFFLTDYDIASGAVRKLLVFPFPLLPLLVGLYCKAQVAIDILEWEKARRPEMADQDDSPPQTSEAPSSSPCPLRKRIVSNT